MNAHDLAMLGLLVALFSAWVALGCCLWWHGLPNNRKVLAVAGWIGYCGALSIVCMILVGPQGFSL